MSPKKQVKVLKSICVKFLANRLMQILSDDERPSNCEEVEKYLEEATAEVIEKLLKYILDSINLDASTRFNCLQVLLRHDVHNLETGMFPHSYYEGILKVLIAKGRGVKILNLKGVWVRDQPQLLSEVIRSMPNLKVLIIPHMGSDEVLDAVASRRSLTVLDISGESCFSIKGLLGLSSCASLTVLNVGNFGKVDVCQQETSGSDVVAELLGNLPNLISLRTYSYTGGSILNLSIRMNSLKYLHDTGTSPEVLRAMINTCSNLESILLDTPDKDVLPDLGLLTKLTYVKLVNYDSNDLWTFLQKSGQSLRVLKLNHNKSSPPLDLSLISNLALNLSTLECYQISALTYLQADAYFMALEDLELLYCDISDSSLGLLLKNSPFLKRVVVGCVINMTDGDIFRLCADCDFGYLEELWFSYAKSLTALSVELLMGHCANLKVVGQLSGWDVSEAEIDYLRAVILSTNTDLTLLPL